MADNEKPLWDLMDEAADTLESASERYHFAGGTQTGRGTKAENIEWSPANLRYVAQQWREEAQAREGVRQGIISLLNINLPIDRRDTPAVADEILDTFHVTPKPHTVDIKDKQWLP